MPPYTVQLLTVANSTHKVAVATQNSAMDALRLLLILSIISSSSSFSPVAFRTEDKVTLAIYYESLCPYCSVLIVNYLYKLFESDLISITVLRLIPYGNAKIKSNSTITCQHGPWECILNTVEACAIDVWPDVKKHFSFIYCVENLVYEHNYTYWETCFEKLGLDAFPVTNCVNSERGKELELGFAAETNALQPPHTYVPWVVVDGQPLYDDYRNFASYICRAYKGAAKPSACTEIPKESEFDQRSAWKRASNLEPTVPKILSWLKRDKKVVSV